MERKIKIEMTCPLCEEKLYSELGEGCKMCGMPIENNKEFCSEKCKINYLLINMKGGVKSEI